MESSRQECLFDSLALGREGESVDGGGLLRHASEFGLGPRDGTFSDSNRAPLHSWFPYLEGYSPRFVERVRSAFLPEAKVILEPFAGSGTTAIVLAQQGIDTGYCEANPAMAYLTGVKLRALSEGTDQAGLARALESLAESLETTLESGVRAEDLLDTYASAFGSSTYFTEEALEAVLKSRHLADELCVSDVPLLGDCFNVAVMASLIRCSLLKRAGDVRYKTKRELEEGIPGLISEVRQRLIAMAGDLAVTAPLAAASSLIADDARCLQALGADQRFDGLITSPPYLNGTNYIRNARLELWYLRLLQDKADLRRMRDGVVTSGINDVSANTRTEAATPEVAEVLKALAAAAYDQRIVKMVAGYFADMREALHGFKAALLPGSPVCIDIGDSVYAGVHVPTDDLLGGIAGSLGYQLKTTVYLRKRRSKGGHELRQTLLVLEAPKRRRRKHTDVNGGSSASVERRWAEFKLELPHQKPPFSKRNWGSALHSLCSYQGKLKPSLAHQLVEVFSSPGDLVVDPFSGAGTIPFEACRTGRRGFGIDLSGLGYVLTKAKTCRPDAAAIDRQVTELDAYLQSNEPTDAELRGAAEVKFNRPIPEYFHPETLREVVLARRYFNDHWGGSAEWAFTFACCLHILHGNRPYALSRRSHPITPFAPTGDFEYRALIPRLRAKVDRSLAVVEPDFAEGGASMADAAETWGLPGEAAAVVTSPPFFDSMRFYMTNWMRYWFTGWERADFDSQTSRFFEKRQRDSLDVYSGFFDRAAEALMPGGYVVMHLGRSSRCDMAAELVTRLGSQLDHVDTFYEEVGHCESHGVRDKGTVNGHSYLIARRR